MNKKLLTVVALGASLSFFGCGTKKKAAETNVAKQMSKIDSVSYAFGVLNGKSFANYVNSVDSSLNKDLIIEGFAKSLKGIPDAQYSESETFFKKWAEEKETAKVEQLKLSSQKYLDDNRKKDGVSETKSGLQYKIIQNASGEKPTVQDTVVVHYEGKLVDGTVFDSSYKRGETAEFPLLSVIPGWTEGICLMPVGSKFNFVIPYNLAYGDRGAGNVIPPYATLIFDVELKSIKKYKEPKSEVTQEVKTDNNKSAKKKNKSNKKNN